MHADNNSVLDMSHTMMRGTQVENEKWIGDEIGVQGSGMDELANSTLNTPLESSDFWLPEVTADCQIYYVNTRTSQHARDLPPSERVDKQGDVIDLEVALAQHL
ncbi:hypothetical protein C8R45DRAFT_950068 [Mycena sanguinolenta]|nr:hypothetical protein C8R45DRAFT_950068 [Mycena sanguinolenta]